MDASSLINLITWDDATTFEPVLTLNMTDDQIHGYESVPMAVPDIPVHGQSMERYVRIIRLLDVCYLIYIFSGVLRRSQQLQSLYMVMRGGGFIRVRLRHRKLTGGVLRSKKDHAKIVEK